MLYTGVKKTAARRAAVFRIIVIRKNYSFTNFFVMTFSPLRRKKYTPDVRFEVLIWNDEPSTCEA